MPEILDPAIDLKIHNDIAELARVSDALARLAKEAAIPGKVVVELQVVLDEVLSNIVKYAWPEGGAHSLQVRVGVRDREVEVVISDDGMAFDPREHRTAVPSPSRAPRAGGLGLRMLEQLVDRIDYARIDGRNRLTLIKQYG